MIVVGVLGLATMIVVMWDKFDKPEYRSMRLVGFSEWRLSYLYNKVQKISFNSFVGILKTFH
jgi:hypothetical protein